MLLRKHHFLRPALALTLSMATLLTACQTPAPPTQEVQESDSAGESTTGGSQGSGNLLEDIFGGFLPDDEDVIFDDGPVYEGLSPDIDGTSMPGTNQLGVEPLPIRTYAKAGHPMKSGRLEVTVTDIRVVDDVSDLPRENLESLWVHDDNGALPEGTYMVLVDLTVRNNGVTIYTTSDLVEDGLPISTYDDPYAFDAWDLIYLMEIHDEVVYYMYQFAYFSHMHQRPEHRQCYRLPDGESMDVTVGFVVADRGDNLDHVYLVSMYYPSEGDTYLMKENWIYEALTRVEFPKGTQGAEEQP